MNKEMKHIVKLSIICAISSFVLFCGSKKNDPSPGLPTQTTNRSKINGKTWRYTSTSFYPAVTVNGIVISYSNKFTNPSDSLVSLTFDLDNSVLTVNTLPGITGGFNYTKTGIQLLSDDSTLVWTLFKPTGGVYTVDTLIVSRASDCKMSIYMKNFPYRVFVPSDTIPHIKYFNYVCN